MMHSIAPDNDGALTLQLDEQGKIARLRNAFECISAGKLLLQLKAALPKDEFRGRAKALGFSNSMASRYMKCARLFDPRRDAALLAAAKWPGKLIQLVALDAEEIEALRLGGQVRGLSLESLAPMTVMQLSKALGRSSCNPRPAIVLTADEESLMGNYRKCCPQARAHVAQAAELLAGP